MRKIILCENVTVKLEMCLRRVKMISLFFGVLKERSLISLYIHAQTLFARVLFDYYYGLLVYFCAHSYFI
uniref:Uncharacterized protein n=1 Tax=Anguilla anguilla TaxID=7936 RepID=A0A0E9X045_ANGAN